MTVDNVCANQKRKSGPVRNPRRVGALILSSQFNLPTIVSRQWVSAATPIN
jgi:hypothetical protein